MFISLGIRSLGCVLFVSALVPFVLQADAPKAALSTHDFREVYAEAVRLGVVYGPEKVLLVFDIDNTLLAMRRGLGSDQWYGWQSTLDESDPRRVGDVGAILDAQGLLYAASSMRPTSPTQPQWVRELQQAGFAALLLTSRGYNFRDATRRELTANGYDFRLSAPQPKPEKAFDFLGPFMPYSEDAPEGSGLTADEIPTWLYTVDGSFVQPRLASYSEGIFMTAGQNKGLMLRSLLHRLGRVSEYEAILYADDLKKHTTRMQAAFADVPVELVTVHYTAEEGNVEAFLSNRHGALDKASEDWDRLWVLLNEIVVPAFTLPDYELLEAGVVP